MVPKIDPKISQKSTSAPQGLPEAAREPFWSHFGPMLANLAYHFSPSAAYCASFLLSVCPHLKRPSARAERASESPPAIVQARRLATRDALASLAVLLLSMPLLLFFLFSAALPALASLAVLDALSPLALPVP